jgi:hypothetical protein
VKMGPRCVGAFAALSSADEPGAERAPAGGARSDPDRSN